MSVCSWCARPVGGGHRPNCPRPDEVFTHADLRKAREDTLAAARERIEALEGAATRTLDWLRHHDSPETMATIEAALDAALAAPSDAPEKP